MLLKALDLQGFKSFPDKTHLAFSKGFSAVVGPNGSGKSNISDAIRWVLGEQSSKTLRGSKMEDVIFVGSKSRRPQGFAQVSLTFDNSSRELSVDSDEVVITRKYYRSGESEYGINGKSVLLKEINELFMDTGFGKDGYSLIGQGKIDEIVSAKSSDRREIFEEAAGISKFRYRKKEAEKRLVQSEENLERLTDILGELKSRIGPLKEQSEKAAKFKKLDDEKQELEISIWIDDLKTYRQKLRQQEDKKIAAQQQYHEQEESIRLAGQKVKEASDELEKAQILVEKLRQQKEEKNQDILKNESQIAVFKNDIFHSEKETQRLLDEINVYKFSGEEFDGELKQKQLSLEEAEAELKKLEEEVANAETHLLELAKEGESKSEEGKEYNTKLNQLSLLLSKGALNLSTNQGKQDELKELIESKTKLLNEQTEELAAQKNEMQEAKKALSELAEREQAHQNEKKGYLLKQSAKANAHEKLEEEVKSLERTAASAAQRVQMLQNMHRSMEGFSRSVKEVLAHGKRGGLKGIHGTVASKIDVPEEFALAIETALGNALQNIIVEDETSAKKAISYLKRENLGRCTFLPLSTMKGKRLNLQGIERQEGYVGVADQLISVKDIYREIFSSLLGRTVIAEDMDSAISIANAYRYGCRIVTLDGQMIHPGGSFTGGSKGKQAGFLTQEREIQRLLDEGKTSEKKLNELREKLRESEEGVAEIQAELDGIDAELLQMSEDRIRFESEQKRLTLSIQQWEKSIEILNMELQEADDKIKLLNKQRVEEEEAIQKAKESSALLLEHQKAFEDENASFAAARKDMEELLSQKRVSQAEKRKEIQAQQDFIEQLRSQSQGNEMQIQKLTIEREEMGKVQEELQGKIENAKLQIEAWRQEKSQLSDDIEAAIADKMQWQQRMTEYSQEERNLLEEKEKSGNELARAQERFLSMQKDCEQVGSKLWEQYRLSTAQAEEIAQPVDDLKEMQRRLERCKATIRGLGQINLGAIEEYQEVSERYTFLNGQMEDIEKSKKELGILIEDLTKKMTELFKKTFDEVNTQFQKVFTELFGGGKASLELEDPSDILNCGILIQVQPPGKIVKHLSALSGGEKAFVAIALYFAILKVKPSPFCVLDEIEAALDDVNVSRFASYLKELSGKTQFIVITHRRGTMELADILYGVTMQEEGCSKLLKMPSGKEEIHAVTA